MRSKGRDQKLRLEEPHELKCSFTQCCWSMRSFWSRNPALQRVLRRPLPPKGPLYPPTPVSFWWPVDLLHSSKLWGCFHQHYFIWSLKVLVGISLLTKLSKDHFISNVLYFRLNNVTHGTESEIKWVAILTISLNSLIWPHSSIRIWLDLEICLLACQSARWF